MRLVPALLALFLQLAVGLHGHRAVGAGADPDRAAGVVGWESGPPPAPGTGGSAAAAPCSICLSVAPHRWVSPTGHLAAFDAAGVRRRVRTDPPVKRGSRPDLLTTSPRAPPA